MPTHEEAEATGNVIECTFSVYGFDVKVLFDPKSTYDRIIKEIESEKALFTVCTIDPLPSQSTGYTGRLRIWLSGLSQISVCRADIMGTLVDWVHCGSTIINLTVRSLSWILSVAGRPTTRRNLRAYLSVALSYIVYPIVLVHG